MCLTGNPSGNWPRADFAGASATLRIATPGARGIPL